MVDSMFTSTRASLMIGEMEMIKRKMKSIPFITLLIFCYLCIVPYVLSQNEQTESEKPKNEGPNVYIECEAFDLDLIKKDIAFVQYVEEPQKAHVYIRILSKETDMGDTEYTISFMGQNECEGDNDELTYLADKDKAEDQVRNELVNTLKMGLMRYVGKSPVCEQISIRFKDKVEPTAVEDKWNFWVFSISTSTWMNGEKLFKGGMYSGSFSANRVTPEMKIQLSLRAHYSKDKFTFDEDVIESTSESLYFSGLIVKSLGEHWSVGAFLSAFSSTYTNVKFSLAPAPAIEYNFFPYSESTRRQLRVLYRLSFNPVRYREETIYQHMHENLWKESLSVTFESKQKWGEMSTSIVGSHYFHDFSKNRIEFWADLSLRLVKGLRFNVDVGYSRIHDQLSLVKGEASLEETLLRIKELETTYSYSISVGLSYTFGSVQSKVVNPRFGTGGRSISISF